MNSKGFSLIEIVLSLFLFTMTIVLLSPIIYNSLNNIKKSYIKYDMDYIMGNLMENIISYVDTNIDRNFYDYSIEELLGENVNKEVGLNVNNCKYTIKISVEKNIEGLDNYIGEIYYEPFDYTSNLSIQLKEK